MIRNHNSLEEVTEEISRLKMLNTSALPTSDDTSFIESLFGNEDEEEEENAD